VNPLVAVLLGWALLNEPLSGRVLAAAAIIVAAVVVITLGKRPRSTMDAEADGATAVGETGGEGRRSAA
jgi:drug/metabolite transporter (DMT)-like permease